MTAPANNKKKAAPAPRRKTSRRSAPVRTEKITVSLRVAPGALEIADSIADDTEQDRADAMRESLALGILLRAAMCPNTGGRDPEWLALQLQPAASFLVVFLARHGLPLAEVMGGSAGGAPTSSLAVSAALSAIDPTVRENLAGLVETL